MIKNIAEGGFGGEAEIKVELRNQFPGLGGTITTQQPVVVAIREEFNQYPGQGRKLFLKHAIIKKMDDYFLKTGKYTFTHIPRPIGSVEKDEKKQIKESYLYEWVFGTEGFPWSISNLNNKHEPVQVNEWIEFTNSFNTSGIKIDYDCTDADDGRISKNIIHQLYNSNDVWKELNCLWQRIDFGGSSVIIDFQKLSKFISDRETEMISVLGIDRFELIFLATVLLEKGEDKIPPKDLGKLEILSREYRLSTLRHLIAKNGNIVAAEPFIHQR